jgi:hypothetical protein
LYLRKHLDQLTTDLRSAVAANTSIKLAGGVSDKDARALASDMRTTAEFIASMKKRAKSTEFACYVRNHTENALRLQIPFAALETAPRMGDEEHKAVVARCRAQFRVDSAGRPERDAPSGADAAEAAREQERMRQPTTSTLRKDEKPIRKGSKPISRSEPEDWRS